MIFKRMSIRLIIDFSMARVAKECRKIILWCREKIMFNLEVYITREVIIIRKY